MANIKISDLTAAAAATGTQEFEVNDSLSSKKVTGAQILSYVHANTGVADVDGLQTALDGKLSTANGSVGTANLANGAVTVEKLGFTIASDALTKSFPVKSGGAVTRFKAVSLNAAGEVGEYPVVNTLGTVREDNTSTVFYNSVSRNGSRAVRWTQIANPIGSQTVRFTGIALTDSNAPVIGGTTADSILSFSFNSPSSTEQEAGSADVIVLPLYEDPTRFLVIHHSWRRVVDTGAGPAWRTYVRANLFILAVDANGNLTKSSEGMWSQLNQLTYEGYNVFCARTSLTADTFVFGYRLQNFSSRDMRYISVSGTTITTTNVSTDNTSLFSIADYWSFINQPRTSFIASNTRFVRLTWDAVRVADVTGGQIAGSFTTNAFQNDLSSNGNAFTALLSENRGFVVYRRNDQKMWLQIIEWNNSGVPTIVSQRILKQDASIFQFSNMDCHVKSATEFVVTYRDGPSSFCLSVLLNSNGTVNSTNILPITQDTAGQQVRLNNSAANRFFYVYSQTVSGTTRPRMVPINVNAYGTIPFNYLGFPVASSAGPTVGVIVSGVVPGFTGLFIGSSYYIDVSLSDGTLTTAAEGNILVGRAVSATELLI